MGNRATVHCHGDRNGPLRGPDGTGPRRNGGRSFSRSRLRLAREPRFMMAVVNPDSQMQVPTFRAGGSASALPRR